MTQQIPCASKYQSRIFCRNFNDWFPMYQPENTNTHACKTKRISAQCPVVISLAHFYTQTFKNSHILLHWSEVRRGLLADRQIKTEEEKIISRIKLIMRESGWDDHTDSGEWRRNETSASGFWFTNCVINVKLVNRCLVMIIILLKH